MRYAWRVKDEDSRIIQFIRKATAYSLLKLVRLLWSGLAHERLLQYDDVFFGTMAIRRKEKLTR